MNIYTSSAILEKYNITDYKMKGTEKFIQFMKQRGVILELVEPARGRAKSTFKILSEIPENPNEIWKAHPIYSDWEFSNCGNVRNSQTKKYYGKGQKASDGYYSIAISDTIRLKVHRGVMMSFYPIEHSENFVVDHINGQRGNNNLSNLRWVFQTENAQFSDENNTKIKEIIANLVQKYGYEATKDKLLSLLDE